MIASTSSNTRSQILIAGVGNIFLGDDAFGVEVVQRLAARPIPENVRVIDFGIRSYDLAYALMEPWELVILVDALPRGDQPGTVFLFEPTLPPSDETPAEHGFDAHSMNPVSVLQLVTNLGGEVSRMLVVGCEPATVEADDDGRMGLSDAVHAAIDEAIRIVEDLIYKIEKPKAA